MVELGAVRCWSCCSLCIGQEEVFESGAQTAVVPRCGVRDCPVVEGESRTIRRSRETEPESTPRLSPAEWPPRKRTDTANNSRHTPSSFSRLLLFAGAVQVVERATGVGEAVGAASYGTPPAGRGVLVGGSRCGKPRSAPFRGRTVQWPRANHRHARPSCARRSACLGSVSCTCRWLQVRPEPVRRSRACCSAPVFRTLSILETPAALPLALCIAVPSVLHVCCASSSS